MEHALFALLECRGWLPALPQTCSQPNVHVNKLHKQACFNHGVEKGGKGVAWDGMGQAGAYIAMLSTNRRETDWQFVMPA
jgi:hypothetical protein